jgi:hypothetical protein
MFPKKHPELYAPSLTPFTKNKPLKDLFLIRYRDGPESAEKLGADAANAQSQGFPHGVSTLIRFNPPSYARSAKLLDVMSRFVVLKTGNKPDHFTVVLPNPVTQQAADAFNSLFIKR